MRSAGGIPDELLLACARYCGRGGERVVCWRGDNTGNVRIVVAMRPCGPACTGRLLVGGAERLSGVLD